jgi:D-alanyl-D-alanine carboxypeptidase
MKTGFTCPAGLNVVASATRGGRRLIAVVMGYPTAKSRTLEAAHILDVGFSGGSTGRSLASLPTTAGDPPNMREAVCGAHRQEVVEDDFAVKVAGAPQPSAPADDSPLAFFRNEAQAAPAAIDVGGVAATQAALAERPAFQPIDVYVGRAPGWTGPAAGPVGAESQVADNDGEAKPAKRRGRKSKAEKAAAKAVVAKADVKTDSKTEAKAAKAKPVAKAATKKEPPKKVAHAATPTKPKKSKTE